jgi:hypothetical protein
MRAILIGILISLPLMSACDGEHERVYAEAKKCAAEITRGSDCAKEDGQHSGGPQSHQVQNTNLQQQPSKPVQMRSSSIEESRVYLDATESMKGFVSQPNSTFTKLIESLSYAMPGCLLYKYGMMRGRELRPGTDIADFANEIRFSQELRKPSFYDRDYNEDDVLFNYLAREERSVRSVLVTDGVYSARQSELQSEVVKAIDKWMESGRFFGILIFNSPYDGKLYSENKRAWIDKVNVSERPFYAFVFSPDEQDFRRLRDKLSAEFKDMQSLVFPNPAIFCQLRPEPKQGLIYKEGSAISPFYLQMYDQTIFNDKNLAELTYEFQCIPAKDYPVMEFGLDVALDSYSWQQDAFKKSERPPQPEFLYPSDSGSGKLSIATSPLPDAVQSATVASTPTPDSNKLPKLKLTFHKDTGTSYSFYHPIFSLASKSLQPNIRNRSTEDDSQAGDANKTYRFYEFISALTTVHLQNKEVIKLPPLLFVTIANK